VVFYSINIILPVITFNIWSFYKGHNSSVFTRRFEECSCCCFPYETT